MPGTTTPAPRLRDARSPPSPGRPGRPRGPGGPGLTDAETGASLTAARDAGARAASWIMLRLPLELDELFQEWLQRHFPQRVEHVMNRIRDLRGGKSYDSAFGRRMTGIGPYADLIRQRFSNKSKRLGLNLHQAEPLRNDLFRRPAGEQMGLW